MRAHIGFTTIGLVVAGLAVSAGTALGASPTAFWHMDETSGTVARDGTGHGYDGTIQKVKLGVAGVSKTGFEFNGTSSRILVKDAPGLRAGDKDLVVTLSVSFSSVPSGDYDLIRKGLSTSSGGDWKMEILSNGKAFCYFKGSKGSIGKSGGPNLADGKYHKITCEKHATTVALVVDGSRYTSTKTVGSISNTATLSIGAKAAGGDWYKGRMDEVSVTIG
ncbi:MAG: LamG-like jellyroll fold domain-containing protein [Chloroflexota bacterium]